MSPFDILPDPSDKDRQLQRTHGAVWGKSAVKYFNRNMLKLADRLIVGESERVLVACVK